MASKPLYNKKQIKAAAIKATTVLFVKLATAIPEAV